MRLKARGVRRLAHYYAWHAKKCLNVYRIGRIMRSMHKGIGKVRLPALISEYARLDGRSRNTIAWYARNAREAGKMPTTKRGRGAAYMGVREAVNLILACNCTEDPKEGANVIEKYRSYEVSWSLIGSRRDPELALDKELDEIKNSNIREIAMQPNLGKVLEKLIHLTPKLFGTLYKNMQHLDPERNCKEIFTEIATTHNISLSIEEHAVILKIKAHSLRVIVDRFEKNSVEIMYTDDMDKQMPKSFGPPTEFRHVKTTLRFGLFLGLAKLFFEDSMQFPDELIPQSIGGGGDG